MKRLWRGRDNPSPTCAKLQERCSLCRGFSTRFIIVLYVTYFLVKIGKIVQHTYPPPPKTKFLGTSSQIPKHYKPFDLNTIVTKQKMDRHAFIKHFIHAVTVILAMKNQHYGQRKLTFAYMSKAQKVFYIWWTDGLYQGT